MDSKKVMDNKTAVLEYCRTRRSGRNKWTFRFKTPDGKTVMESAEPFASKAKAEIGFLNMVKSIATNDYSIGISE
jgi:uncharacterized protein YegP (UPF0339 family)